MKYQNEFSSVKEIKSGVPQESIIFGPSLYTLYTANIPNDGENIMVATFANNMAICISWKGRQYKSLCNVAKIIWPNSRIDIKMANQM